MLVYNRESASTYPDPWPCTCKLRSMNQAGRLASTKKRLLLGGYFSSMKDEDAKKRYLDKLQVVGGLDPYETEKNEWLICMGRRLCQN